MGSEGGNKGEKEEPKEEEIHEVPLDPNDGTKVTSIRVALEDELRSELVTFLKRNIDCFTWSYLDIEGIDPKVITHRLNVDPSFFQ